MPVIKLKAGGSAAKKSPVKKASAKPAARSTRKATTRKPATKPAARKPATKKTTGAKKASTPRKPPTPKTDPKIIAKHVKILEQAGKKRDQALTAHEEAVEGVFKAVQAAIAEEVPMGIIANTVGVSRQWLYKMGEFKDRSNGSKPAAKRATTKKPAAKKGGAKPSGSTRRRVRTRS